MNKLLMTLLVIGLLGLTGCSQKEESVENSSQNNQDVQNINNATESEAILNNVYFYFDSTELDDKAKRTISENAYFIKLNNKTVTLEGHTDEWGSDEYNYALGLKRAEATKTELKNQGVNTEDIDLISYGESKRVCINRTFECDAQNRRVESK